MRFKLIRLVPLAMMGAFSAVATAQMIPNPGDVSLGQPAYGGSGCPAGTASVALSPDRKSLSMIFDSYSVEAGRQVNRNLEHKSCDLAVPVNVPAGFSVSVMKVDFRGFTAIPAGGRAMLSSEYFFAGQIGPHAARTFMGPAASDFTNSDEVTAVAWSECGAPLTMRMHSGITVMANSAGDQTNMSVDSVDAHMGVIYQLQYRSCGVAQPAPQPPVYQPAPQPPVYQPAPQPPVYQPAPQPPVYQPQPAQPQGYLIQNIRAVDSQMISWDNAWRNAQYGSFAQSAADQSRRAAGSQMLSILNDVNALSMDASAADLENLAREMQQKYQAAPYGSYTESVYNQVSAPIWQAHRLRLSIDVGYMDWRGLLNAAIDFQAKYQAAPYGSKLESNFAQARDLAFSSLDVKFAQEIDSYSDFRQIEPVAIEMYGSYQSAAYGSKLEAAFKRMSDHAFGRAEQVASYQIPQMDRYTLSNMGYSYDNKFQQARYGSRPQAYYRSVRDRIRSALGMPLG